MSDDNIGTVSGPLTHRGLQLALSTGYHSNPVPSPETSSPCSSSSPSNFSDLDGSSPDVNMLECCVLEDSPVGSPVRTPSENHCQLSDVRKNLNQAYFTTPLNDSLNGWNQNISLRMTPEVASPEDQKLRKHSEVEDGLRRVTSQGYTERDSPLYSCDTSCRSHNKTDCCSVSSGELVMRNNSFCLEDETFPVMSSLEESIMSPVKCSGDFIAEGQHLSSHLPDVCVGLQEKSTEAINSENTNHACFGMAIQEDDLIVNLPTETEAGCLTTFLCESSYSAGILPLSDDTRALPKHSDTDICPILNGTFEQAQGKSIVTQIREELDSASNIQTSTPELHIGNMIRLPSLSESPFSGSADSPVICPPQSHQIPQNPRQQLIGRLSLASSKAVKTEIKKFPKPDFSGVKSKIMTRLTHQLVPPGSAPTKVTHHKPSKVNGQTKPSQVNGRAANKTTDAKPTHTHAANTTLCIGAPGEENEVTGDWGKTFIQLGEDDGSAAQSKSGLGEDVEGAYSLSSGAEHASSALSAKVSPGSEPKAPGQVLTSTPTQQPGNETFCCSSPLETVDKNDQTGPKPSPKKAEASNRTGLGSGSMPSPKKAEASNRTGLGSGSTLRCDTPHFAKTRSSVSFDGSSSSQSRPPKEKRTDSCASLNSSAPRPSVHLGQSKSGYLSYTAQTKQGNRAEVKRGTPESANREVRKISLVVESKVAEASGSTSSDQSKSKVGGRPSPRKSRLPTPRPAATSPGSRPVHPSSRQRQVTSRRDGYSIPRSADLQQIKQRDPFAHPRALVIEKPTLGNPATRTKPPVNGFRPLQTSSRPSAAGPSSAVASKPPHRSAALEARGQPERSRDAGSAQVTAGASLRPIPFKTVVLKRRSLSMPAGDSGSTLAPAVKSATSNKPGPSRSTISPPKRNVSSKIGRLSLLVDKNKAKTSSRQQPAAQPAPSNEATVLVPADVVDDGRGQTNRKDHILRKLHDLLNASNCKFEAIALVLQRTLAERDEAVSQRRQLSQELVNLRGELVCTAHSCERLEKEKEEVRVALEEALQRVQDHHHDELAQLEHRLQAFYQAEWDKVHLAYQEEADKCRALMEQQMGELKASHEVTKLELEASHLDHLQHVKRQHEDSLEELRRGQNEDLQTLKDTLKEAEATLSGRIQELSTQNQALIEKLKAEADRRKLLAGKSQKDSHTLYLEQELESLKVVLDIKNKQLHQQENKITQMDSLVDKNVKLDECLKKVQQENEHLKARMDRHAALSRQLSTEQAVLHESLQKESKVNKRLSMENEELLWKLHNGELSGSPRRTSPTSPPHSNNSFQSTRGSAFFSSPPVSPR